MIKSLVDRELIELTCRWIDRMAGDGIWQVRFADGSVGEVSYLQGNRNDPKEVLEIDAPHFTATLGNWKRLTINGKTILRNWLGQDKGQSAAIDTFARAITSGERPDLMPSIEEEIDSSR